MTSALLGLPLGRAIDSLTALGLELKAVERLLPPRFARPEDESGLWRVVRVRGEGRVTLDVCWFKAGIS